VGGDAASSPSAAATAAAAAAASAGKTPGSSGRGLAQHPASVTLDWQRDMLVKAEPKAREKGWGMI